MTDDRDDVVPPHLASLVGRMCVCDSAMYIKTQLYGGDAPGFEVSDEDFLSWLKVAAGVKFLAVDAAVKYDIDEHCPLMWLKVVTDIAPDVLCGWVCLGAVTAPNSRRTPKIQVTPVDC